MHKLSKIALLAVAGGLAVMTPALAAPPMGGPRGPQIDCSLPENAANPFCLNAGGDNRHRNNPNGNGNGGQGGNGAGPNDDNNGPGGGPPPGGSGPGDHGNGPGGNGPGNGPGPGAGGNGPGFPGGFNFSQHDRDQFHRRFGPGFNFGFNFGTPSFSIQLGTPVPRSYGLKPVPRSIYRYYPQFRGYLFFQTRRGSIVIVSPRSHRIVAVL